MIFVTVGTHEYKFNRLVQAADELVEFVDEEVVIQRGSSDYIPCHATYFDWATSNEMETWIERSRLIISHAGAGTIIMTFKHDKKMVLAPRLAARGEVFNDHQLQLANIMQQKGNAVVVLDLTVQSLLDAIKQASEQNRPIINSSSLIEAIHIKLSNWQELLINMKQREGK